jgi:hypothetical protein
MNEFNYVKKQVVYKTATENIEANRNMRDLEDKLESFGFSQIGQRVIKWDHLEFIKYMDNSGRYVIASTYFDGDADTIRKKHSVNIEISGLDYDVRSVENFLDDKKYVAYTCR